MDHCLKVQEIALLGMLFRERSAESRARLEVLLAEVRERQIETLRAIEGLWRDRDDLGPTDEYVRRSRRDTRRSRRS